MTKTSLPITLIFITLICFYSCKPQEKQLRTDLSSDTIYEKVSDEIYKDKQGKVYILTTTFRPTDSEDNSGFTQYYKDITEFLDITTYAQLKEDYFQNKGKVYFWGANSDGNYPIEVTGADPKTFEPFKEIAGGKDKQHVFYGGVPDDFSIIQDADPASIKVLNPERGCWNCQSCYFTDKKSVFYGLQKIEGADPATFKLINQETIDAEDKNGKYFEGHLLK